VTPNRDSGSLSTSVGHVDSEENSTEIRGFVANIFLGGQLHRVVLGFLCLGVTRGAKHLGLLG